MARSSFSRRIRPERLLRRIRRAASAGDRLRPAGIWLPPDSPRKPRRGRAQPPEPDVGRHRDWLHGHQLRWPARSDGRLSLRRDSQPGHPHRLRQQPPPGVTRCRRKPLGRYRHEHRQRCRVDHRHAARDGADSCSERLAVLHAHARWSGLGRPRSREQMQKHKRRRAHGLQREPKLDVPFG